MLIKNFIFLSCVFMINIFVVISTSVKLPPDVQLCKFGDLVCISKVSTDIIQANPKGRAEIDLQQIDPYHVNNLIINQAQSGPIALDLSFKDLDIEGLSKMSVQRAVGFEKDPKTSKFEMYGLIPQLKLKGKYKIGGKILLLPIRGEGNSEIILSNVKASVKFKPAPYEKNGKTYLGIEKLKCILEPEKMQAKLENLFDGDPELGKQMNIVINENWKEIWNDLSSSIDDTVSEIIKSIMRPLFKKYAYEDVFLQ